MASRPQEHVLSKRGSSRSHLEHDHDRSMGVRPGIMDENSGALGQISRHQIEPESCTFELVNEACGSHIQSQASFHPEPASESRLQSYQALLLNVIFTLQCSV